ncbi:MAG: hypothetical protein NC403_01335 [Muribaculaceae bacterium]|nr:hypothetical protein [Muribaculaceae bacterium]
MAKYLRYMGEFLSRAGIVWRVEILQEADAPFDKIGSLTFEADEPLVIEWDHTEKEEVIGGSTATLRIESPGDRTYEDLYTIAPGRIRMDVYRNNLLYWSGALDPEFYEEPYERAANYPVSLTFSDFGVLDRLKYDLSGMRTLYDIVAYSVSRTAINTILDESLISTSINPTGVPMGLADLKVRSDNFYDEDGEALTLKEVLEGVLQPLALRMMQRAGRVYIYDLNALYTEGRTEPVIWDGDSQTMGTDRVYNNAKITWSTYAQSGNLSKQDCWTLETNATDTAMNMTSGRVIGDATIFSYHYATSLNDWVDLTDVGFTIWLSEVGINATLVNSAARFYRIVPQYDGQESEGIAIKWPGVNGFKVGSGHNYYAQMQWARHGLPTNQIAGTAKSVGGIIFKTAPIWVPPVDKSGGLVIRVLMDMLLDPRFNPFESSVKWMDGLDQADHEKKWNLRGNFMYVPVTIKFKPDNSNDVYCWTNTEIVKRDVKSAQVSTLNATYGSWVKDTSTATTQNVWGYLAYYTTDDRAEKSGVVGWRKNRPAINPHTGKIISVLANSEDGQYIPYPNFGTGGGELWVEVRSGWVLSDGNSNIAIDSIIDSYGLWNDKFNWILCKLPEVEIMNSSQFDKTINTDDVEYNAEINAEAKEDIELDTICGSSAEGVPTARGAYFSTTDGKQIIQLTRAGRTSQIEDLLIGTLFSQFGQRRTKLSGEMKIAAGELSAYTEANQEGKKFMITEDTQNVIADTSDATVTELRPDEYERRLG